MKLLKKILACIAAPLFCFARFQGSIKQKTFFLLVTYIYNLVKKTKFNLKQQFAFLNFFIFFFKKNKYNLRIKKKDQVTKSTLLLKNKNNVGLASSRIYSSEKEIIIPIAKEKQVVSITYEEIGLFPRSFSRVFDRFVKQLFYDVENLVLQEYRFYRYLFLTTIKCVFILFFVPFMVSIFAKNFLVRPLTEYFWNTKQTEIFLNAYQQKHAFSELQDFNEKLYFESLISPHLEVTSNVNSFLPSSLSSFSCGAPLIKDDITTFTPFRGEVEKPLLFFSCGDKNQNEFVFTRQFFLLQTVQDKTATLAWSYNNKSIEAITNFFADLLSFITLYFLFCSMEIQINITKSFLLEVFFGLDDSKKSLLILLVTDLLVGYHSDGPWAILFQALLNHYGFPESQTGIFLLVATLPVLLDVLFKYLIFRHLNRASPATVATYHAMIE